MSSTKHHNCLFALIDCNSFYASCERVFNPKLLKIPVVVLSSNDGCIIARSKEAKDLGIPMGAPFFQWSNFFKTHKVYVCSSNFALYSDLSQRVMQAIDQFHPDKEIYSIDECFLSLNDYSKKEAWQLCQTLKESIEKWVGIPVSIGIGATKTLAKVANHYAKSNFYDLGLFEIDEKEEEKWLSEFAVGKIWGIGRRLEDFLHKQGIKTALALRNKTDEWIKSQLSVTGLKTVWELRGISCIGLEEAPSAKKSIISSRSFGQLIESQKDLAEAISTYTARAAEKMRAEGSLASFIEVFIRTSPHRNEPFYTNSIRIIFPEPCDYTPEMISAAKFGLSQIFLHGKLYKKAGVMLGGLIPIQAIQQSLFLPQDENARMLTKKKKNLMHLTDVANQKFGYDILQLAAEGTTRLWKMHQGLRSQAFTTNWKELLTIKI